MNNILTFKSFSVQEASKVILAILTLTVLAYFSHALGVSEILSLLSKNGVKITPGLAEGLAAANSVADVNLILAGAAGITIAPWLAAAVASLGAASL